jgi:hypothetical protein
MKLTRSRTLSLIYTTADILRCGEPTYFALEGACRTGLRIGFIAQSASWPVADLIAHHIIISALNLIGARRPTWQEGQPEYTQDGAITVQRERCLECCRPLPEGHWRFCSEICGSRNYDRRFRSVMNTERAAQMRAYRATRREKNDKVFRSSDHSLVLRLQYRDGRKYTP